MTATAPSPTPETTNPRRRRLMIGGGILAVILIVAGVGLWWFFRDDAPAEVDLATAVEQVTSGDEASTGDAPAGGGDVEIDGAWAVDTSIGDFDFETATGSFAGFRVEEELSTIGSTTAVGRTGGVAGTLEIEGTTLSSAEISADLSQITTNDSRRDSRARGALDTDNFPEATFVLAEPVDFGAAAAEGEAVSVTATGDLTIKGVTQRVEFPLQAQLSEGVVVVVGSLDVTFSDFDVEVPSAPIVVSVDDEGVLELQLLFTKA
ncbi:MAG: YceI family protein [Actinomycetota bacterium]